MTALIRNPLVWHGAVGILLILGFVFGGSVLGAAWPIVAVVVWCYVTWRLLAGRAALRLAAMQVHVLDRTPPKVPRIDGDGGRADHRRHGRSSTRWPPSSAAAS